MPKPSHSILIRALKAAYDDLIWCSGSADFAKDGQAHEGWVHVRLRMESLAEILKAANELPSLR